ncbi:hypothetical protein C0995_004584 [Termitomyces sp. Mi166|nr:hypothetical protein C0995_004584 [Termitomyces sp. Mi166\
MDSLQYLYGGTLYWPAFTVSPQYSDSGEYGAINVLFRGTSIAFFGFTPWPKCSQYFVVSIDGGEQYNAFFQDPTPPSRQQLYQTPVLKDTQHVITLTRIPGLNFDYAVITAGQDTPLDNQRLIVDDGDTISISYAGNWDHNTARSVVIFKRDIEGYSYGNATHDTSTPGSSATVAFSGSSPAVYGTINYYNLGDVSVKYTLDGVTTTTTYSSTPEIQQTDVVYGNNLLFSDDSISPGDHTLEIEVIDCVNQTFSLDYFTYSPSFKTLAEKPHSTNGTASSTTQTITQTATSTSSSNQHVPIGAIKDFWARVAEKNCFTPTTGRNEVAPDLPMVEPFMSPPLSPPSVYTPLRKGVMPITLNSGNDSLASGSTSPPTTPYTRAMVADRESIVHYPQGQKNSEGVYSPSSPPPYYQG